MKIDLAHNTYEQPGGEDGVFEQERRLLERAAHNVLVYRRSNLEIEELSAARTLHEEMQAEGTPALREGAKTSAR